MSLGNLLGLGGATSSGGSSFGASNNPKKVIRNIDFKSRELKKEVRNSSPIRAWHKEKIKKAGKSVTKIVRDVIAKNKVEHVSQEEGQRVIKTDYNDNILKVVQGSVKSGQTVSSWKNNLNNKRKLSSVASNGRKIVYHFSGDKLNREKRNKMSKIFDSKGPTKKQIKFEEKKKKGLEKLNIFQTNRSRDEADQRAVYRNNPKANLKKQGENSSRLGIQGKKYKTSTGKAVQSTDDFRAGGQVSGALQGSYTEKAQASSMQGEGATSIASGLGSKPQEDNVVEADFNKDQKPLDNNIMPRTGTDG